jgi:hypothetical protein
VAFLEVSAHHSADGKRPRHASAHHGAIPLPNQVSADGKRPRLVHATAIDPAWLVEAAPFDMFPNAAHVETLAVFEPDRPQTTPRRR